VITAVILSEAMAIPLARAAQHVEGIKAAIKYAELNTDRRLAHFLAQVGHETGRLRFMREIWGPTAAQNRYERDFEAPWPATPILARQSIYKANRLAFTLGNARKGDGLRYMGRGALQTTGAGNYGRLTKRLKEKLEDECPDFLAKPALLELSPWNMLSAADYWVMRNLNEFADLDDILGLTKRVNGGVNGLADRQAIYASAWLAITKGR
jgi:putative chitinase